MPESDFTNGIAAAFLVSSCVLLFGFFKKSVLKSESYQVNPLWHVAFMISSVVMFFMVVFPPKPERAAPPEITKMLSNQWGAGHQAGYDWARRNGITEHDQCRGNSKSFVDGCREYLTEICAASSDETVCP